MFSAHSCIFCFHLLFDYLLRFQQRLFSVFSSYLRPRVQKVSRQAKAALVFRVSIFSFPFPRLRMLTFTPMLEIKGGPFVNYSSKNSQNSWSTIRRRFDDYSSKPSQISWWTMRRLFVEALADLMVDYSSGIRRLVVEALEDVMVDYSATIRRRFLLEALVDLMVNSSSTIRRSPRRLKGRLFGDYSSKPSQI